MADAFVQISADGTGKRLDAELLTVAGNPVYRERDRLAGEGADDLAVVTDTDPVEVDHGVVVRPINVVNPIRDTLTSAALAAGGSVDLDGTTIASGKIGKLQAVMCASTAGLCKFTIKARDGGVETVVGVLFTSQDRPTFTWVPPEKQYDTLLGNGVDENFRVTAKNLDALNAADVYATIYWDEVG